MGFYNNNDDDLELQTIDVNSKKTPKSARPNLRKDDFDEYDDDRPIRTERVKKDVKPTKAMATSNVQYKKKKKKRKNSPGVTVALSLLIFILLVSCAILFVVIRVRSKVDMMNHLSEDEYASHEYTVPVTERADIETEDPNIEETTYSEIELAELKKQWEAASNDAKAFFESGEAVSADYVTNILLVGTDLRPKEFGVWPGLADTNILVSINNKTKKVVLTSFMRDTFVYIPASTPTFNRLNYAHGHGDAGLLMSTIEGNFKVKVDKFVRVNIYDLIKIIDAVGGIDMEVSEEERVVLNETYIYWMCYEAIPKIENPEQYYLQEAGNVHLTGMQAVAFARVRYVGNADYERTERQRRVVTAIVDNCKKMNPIQLDTLASNVMPLVSTNMSTDEIMSYVANAFTYMSYSIESQRVPFPNTSTVVDNEYGRNFLLPDYKTNADYLVDSIYGD